MSYSWYLVSSQVLTSDDVIQFYTDIQATVINAQKCSAQRVHRSATVWIDWLGTSVLDESDEEERQQWNTELGALPCHFLELTLGKGAGSDVLAFHIVLAAMDRWHVIIDDTHGGVYSADTMEQLMDIGAHASMNLMYP